MLEDLIARLDAHEERISKLESKREKFIKPTLEEVQTYCKERKNTVDSQKWMDHYISNGWKIGKALAPMKDWRAAVRTWERSPYDTNTKGPDYHREELVQALKDSSNRVMPQLSAGAKKLFYDQKKHWRDLQAEVQAGIISV